MTTPQTPQKMINPDHISFYCRTCEGELDYADLVATKESADYILFTEGTDDWANLVCPECGDSEFQIGVKI